MRRHGFRILSAVLTCWCMAALADPPIALPVAMTLAPGAPPTGVPLAATGTISTFARFAAQQNYDPSVVSKLFPDDPQIAPIILDTAGNVVMAQKARHIILQIRTDGTTAVVAGIPDRSGFGGDGGPANAAQLSSPSGIASDGAGGLYIADSGNMVIRHVSASGTIATIAGTPGTAGYAGDGGPASAALLRCPQSVARDPTGVLYIGECEYNAGVFFRPVPDPRAVYGNNDIRRIARDGTISTTKAAVSDPAALVSDAAGNMFVASHFGAEVTELTAAGVPILLAKYADYIAQGGDEIIVPFAHPTAIAIDNAGNIFVADPLANIICRIAPDELVTTVAGLSTHPGGPTAYSGDGGPANVAELNRPEGLAVDAAGNLLVVDALNGVIRKISAPGPASVAIVTPPMHGTATVRGTTMIYQPGADYTTGDSFTYAVSNQSGTSAPATVSIAAPTVPVAAAANVVTPFATGLNFTPPTSGGPVLLYRAVTQPAHGFMNPNVLGFFYQPNLGFSGTDSFTYVAVSYVGTSAPARITVTVTPPFTGTMIAPQAGVWVDPSSPGSQWSVTPSLANGRIFVAGAAFSDSGSGAPDWLEATTYDTPANIAYGVAMQCAGGSALESGDAVVPACTVLSNNNFVMYVTSPTSIVLHYHSRWTPLVPLFAPPAAGPAPGMWWDPTELGTGWTLNATPSGGLFVTGFGFDPSGARNWLTSTLQPMGGGIYLGEVQRCANGQPLASTAPAAADCAIIGPYLWLATGQNGSVTLEYGGRKASLIPFTVF